MFFVNSRYQVRVQGQLHSQTETVELSNQQVKEDGNRIW